MMTLRERFEYVGRTCTVQVSTNKRNLGSISIPARIKDVRDSFGNMDFLVQPLNGVGEAWVRANRVTVQFEGTGDANSTGKTGVQDDPQGQVHEKVPSM